jgi:hypothetical protein
MNLKSKSTFFSPEDKFEKLHIPELVQPAGGLQNAKKSKIQKVKSIIFDFQIKNADEYVYEKIIID